MFRMRRFDAWRLHVSIVYNPHIPASPDHPRFGYLFHFFDGGLVFTFRVGHRYLNIDVV